MVHPHDAGATRLALAQRKVDLCLGLAPATPSLPQALEPSIATLGRLYAAGADLTWGTLVSPEGRCVRLPTYPWQKQRHWAPRNPWNAPAPVAAEASTPTDSNAPAQRSPRPDLTTPYVAPQPGLEATLAKIWEEVLQVDRIGVHDNFFALGGHSLLATQVVSRITGSIRADLPLREMFQSPTIAELAGRIGSATAGDVRPADRACAPRRRNVAILYPGSPLVSRPVGTRPGNIHDLFPLADQRAAPGRYS